MGIGVRLGWNCESFWRVRGEPNILFVQERVGTNRNGYGNGKRVVVVAVGFCVGDCRRRRPAVSGQLSIGFSRGAQD
jgi:hypothetical protein